MAQLMGGQDACEQDEDDLEEEYDYSIRYAGLRWRRSAQRGRSERGTGDGTGSVRVWKTSQGLFGALHFAARSGSDIQFLVIICFLGDEEGLKLLDCEFTTKRSALGCLAIAWKLKVLAIIDARRTGEKPFFDGIWDVQPKSLSPNGAILGDVIRQGEEVRVREKCGGFVLVIEGACITHRPFKGHVPRLGHTLSELQKIGE